MGAQIYFEKKVMQGSRLGPQNVFPSMRNALIRDIKADVDPSDGLRIGYGLVPNIMPHMRQDEYGTLMEEMSFDSAVLENEFLKARFLPGLGARLWSLYDKKKKRDLVVENPVFKPGNFAVRNAWVAGGVEWNIGSRGHDAYTCSPLFTAVTADEDGTPVLRFYEFSRVRAVVYQMDFFLPENSRFLFVRVRIENPNPREVPMYWWSNAAVKECRRQRIIVPAVTTFANTYISDTRHTLTKLPLPVCEGFDCTYPFNHWTSKDHFFNIPDAERKFEASIYEDGYGLIQTSTDRLKGRKLFTWGRSPGGLHWQRRLTDGNGVDYAEIQAGLCRTQMEHVPMPAGAVWEWVEAYGAIQTDPGKIFGEWSGAIRETADRLEELLPRGTLDALLERTGKSFAEKPAELVSAGSGWGALENLRREKSGQKKLAEHLDFGSVGAEQSDWCHLLEYGTLPAHDPATPPQSYQTQDEWFELLKKAKPDWFVRYHLGTIYYYREDWENARECIEKSLSLSRNAWNIYALANLCRVTGDPAGASRHFSEVLDMRRNDPPLIKEAFKTMLEAHDYTRLIQTYEALPQTMQKVPLIHFLYADAIARQGDVDAAEQILMEYAADEIPDIREGENSLSELYIHIRRKQAEREGGTLALEDMDIPYGFDLRMNSLINTRRK